MAFSHGPCRPDRPEMQGKVERPFLSVETKLLNGRTFTSLEHLNEEAMPWLAEIADVCIHHETRSRPIGLFEEEKPRRLVLPAQPYETARVLYRTVGQMATLACEPQVLFFTENANQLRPVAA
jgi:hypothetical protein